MSVVKINKLRERRKKKVRSKLDENNRSKKKKILLMISNKHIYAQLIDSTTGKTITSVSTQNSGFKAEKKSLVNKTISEKLAAAFYDKVSKSMKNSKEACVFDRGERLYHGKVKVFADALRKKGMRF